MAERQESGLSQAGSSGDAGISQRGVSGQGGLAGTEKGSSEKLFSEKVAKEGKNGTGTAQFTSVNLSPAVIRALSDRTFEKRKSGAVEIQKAVREKTENGEGGGEEYVVMLINLLTMDYACSINSNQRKGGLLGLAGVSMGLGPLGTPKYLQYLLPPVLKCFDDPEVRVRYYACEALYNIAKTARKHILTYFNGLFDGLCKLFADVDVDVKNGAQLLDRLVKEIVTENCDTFQVELFIPLLERYLRLTNPYIRQFLISWILALDSVPEIDMVVHLPRLLDGVFNMLGDGNREIRQQSDMALSRLMTEIKQQHGRLEERHIVEIVTILISQSSSAHKFSRLTAVTWVHQFIEIFGSRLVLMYSGILSVLLTCLSDSEPEIKAVADRAHDLLLELVRVSDQAINLRPLIAVVTLRLAVPAQSTETDNVQVSASTGRAHSPGQNILVSSSATPLPTRLAALRWLSMLLDKFPKEMGDHIVQLTPVMLAALSDASDELVVLDLDVLARIARNTSRTDSVVGQIVRLFRQDRALFDNRGSFVVRKLCVLLEPSSVYLILAREIDAEQDLEFAHLMVQALNLILLTAPELSAFRATLRTAADGGLSDVFVKLFKTWCFDPVATLSLCLLSQCYDLSSRLVGKLADVNLTVGFLMEVDKLVQLIESPAFLSLRLELVNSGSAFRPALLQTLYGLLMILPQSAAYNVLSNRLNAAASLQFALANNQQAFLPKPSTPLASSAAPNQPPDERNNSKIKTLFSKEKKPEAEQPSRAPKESLHLHSQNHLEKELADHFTAVQSRIIDTYEQAVRSRSLFFQGQAS